MSDIENYLEKKSIIYLERFSSSSNNLRFILINSAKKYTKEYSLNPDILGTIDRIIEKLKMKKVLDDYEYSISKSKKYIRQGWSKKKIYHYLLSKKVAKDIILKCFNEIREEFGSIDKLAALKLAKKRKIGPFRLNREITPENKKKEYALMARSGFSLDIARNILELKDFNNLEKKLL